MRLTDKSVLKGKLRERLPEIQVVVPDENHIKII